MPEAVNLATILGDDDVLLEPPVESKMALFDGPPLAEIDADRCITVDSLSKRVAPGLSVGMLHVPASLRDRVASMNRGEAWTVPPMALTVVVRLMQEQAIPEIVALKREEAHRRQAIMAEMLAPHSIKADPRVISPMA